MIPFVGFAPDLDPATPGVITDCDDLLPTVRGFKSMPAQVATTYPALAAECLGAAIVVKLDATTRLFAGTDTKLYEGASTSWTDVSVGAGTYTSGEKRWRFAQFGNTTIATNYLDAMQSSSSGAFANVTGPKAKCIDAAAGFVMVADTNEGTYGAQSDRWWCSAFQDASDWTPAVATQCTTGRLIESPGPIRAMKALGSDFVAYKDRAMFLGRYVGSPAVFEWTQLPGEIGAAAQEAVVSVGSQHIFVGYEDIYIFDGSRPVAIGAPIKKWFFDNLNKPYRYRIHGMHERSASRVWFFFNKGTSTSLNAAIVYNYVSGQWGYLTLDVETPIEYLTGLITYNTLGDYFSTYNDLPSVSYDSPFWTQTAPVPAIFDTTHTIKLFSGASAGCSITTGDYGDDAQYSLLTRARLRCITSPTSATATNYTKAVAGDSLTTGSTPTMSDGRFDFLASSRWHRLKYDLVGDAEVVGHDLYLVREGTE
jgi:hypothetical protein